MTAIKTVDQLFDQIEYYPMQLDLNKHVFRSYKQLEQHPHCFSIYQHDYIDDQLVTLETLHSLSASKVFHYQKFPQGILNSEAEFKFNILNAFKLYALLQEHMSKQVNFNFEVVSAYQRLDQFFNALNTPPNDEDLRVNKRALGQNSESEQVKNKPSVLPMVLLLLSIIVAIILMLFTSGITSLIFQACLYGFGFLMAKSMMSENQDSTGPENNLQNNRYAMQLDCFLEKNQLNLDKINPQ